MKINNIYITALLLVAALFVGCDDYEDSVEQSPEVSIGNPAIRFASENPTAIELDPTVSVEFTLTLNRDNETDAAEFPITIVTNTESSFIVPDVVSFAAGEKTASITIKMAESAPTLTELPLELTFADEYTNPYKDGYPNYSGKVLIADWEPYATGTYNSWWYEASYSQELQYSPGFNQYRFPNLIADGVHFIFTWDGATTIVPVPKTIETGYVHATYGMVSATTHDATYDAGTKTFTFLREWTVAAGSFGGGNDTYTMD